MNKIYFIFSLLSLSLGQSFSAGSLKFSSFSLKVNQKDCSPKDQDYQKYIKELSWIFKKQKPLEQNEIPASQGEKSLEGMNEINH